MRALPACVGEKPLTLDTPDARSERVFGLRDHVFFAALLRVRFARGKRLAGRGEDQQPKDTPGLPDIVHGPRPLYVLP
jgi:hypothetical protein